MVGRALRRAGVGRNDIVALYADRGLALSGMVLGAFKAGGAYLALDRKHPPQRIAAVLAASRAPVVVAAAEHVAQLEPALAILADPPRLLVFEEMAATELDSKASLAATHPDQAAYVIYTSGSTGEPKGVVVTQRGMLNNQLSKIPYLGLGTEDVIAQTASQSFDISVWQLLAGWLCGACIEIVPDDIARDPLALLECVRANGITVLQSVPALIQGMLIGPPVELPALRWMLPTGEASTSEMARHWLARYPAIPLVNAYGPAECADDVSLHLLDGSCDEEAHLLPIGRPTDNTQLLVLDEQLNLLPTVCAASCTWRVWVSGAVISTGRG
ncbi:AMP-binding protein [Azotobacter sp. CWF10]